MANYQLGDFKQGAIMNVEDFVKTYDVESVTSGFGDYFGSITEMKHTVVAGETLGTISTKYYGTSAKYMDIFNANRPLMSLKGANYLENGWVLTIPAVEVAQSAKVTADAVTQAAAQAVIDSQKPLTMNSKLILIAGLLLGFAYLYKDQIKSYLNKKGAN